ncbi:zinc finger protein 502-like [Sabethes cyaneus]|uniref:zinc finger protein 502-like n=1 Tax=Sabethes cyaneus TaxID=53552 RepID=UPI00237D536A|nr:zinc finger protein 502-like [Sabethes cyaneus]
MAAEAIISSCRICSGTPSISLFEVDTGNAKCLAELIEDFANVTIEQNDGNPSHICSECANNLKKSISFRHQIQDAERIFKNYGQNQLCLSPVSYDVKIELSAVDDDEFEYEYLEEDTTSETNKKLSNCYLGSSSVPSLPEDKLHQDTGFESETVLRVADSCADQKLHHIPFKIPPDDKIAQRMIFDDFEYFEIDGEQCCGCNFIASSRDELVHHSKESHAHNYYPDSSYTCPICYCKYKTQEILAQHIEYYSYRDIFLCTVCNEPFVQKSQLEMHQKDSPKHRKMLEDSKGKITTSNVNTKKNDRNGIRKKHVVLEENSDEINFFCCFVRCWEKFENHEELLEHVEQVHNGKRRENELIHAQSPEGMQHVCSVCKRLFENELKLVHHQSYKQKRVTHSCQECGQIFFKLHALRDHEIKQHSQQPPQHKCDICGKAFRKMSVLKHHRKIHVPFESVPCVEAGCQFVFRDEALMKRHCRNVHGDNFPWECRFCPKKLRTKEAMDIHVRVHTGEKPFPCRQGCDRQFAHATDRARHERSRHTGEKPHKCEQCPAAYVRRRELVVHIKKNHDGE